MAFMYAYMVAIRANEESETKAKRIRAVWSQKRKNAAQGTAKMTSRCPAWLTLSDDRSEFETNKERVAIVKRIFREADNGKGQHAIAEMLNKDGVTTFGNGSRKAQYWHRSYIAKVLSNPAVIGTLVPHVNRESVGKRTRDALKPVQGYYPRIISKTLFERVNSRRSAGAVRMRAKDGKVSNVLAGLAKCPKCGGAMSRVNKGRRGGQPYLVCNAAKAKASGKAKCDYKQIKLSVIEDALIERIKTALEGDIPALDEALNKQATEALKAADGLESSIYEILLEIERGNSSAALRQRLSKLEIERDEAEADWQELKTKVEAGGNKTIDRILATLKDKVPLLADDVTAANIALRDAFEKCVVDYETGWLELHWKHADSYIRLRFDTPQEWEELGQQVAYRLESQIKKQREGRDQLRD